MGVTVFLAFAILAHADEVAPEMIQPFTSRDACLVEASKQNHSNPVVKNANPALGARFVCLEIVYPT